MPHYVWQFVNLRPAIVYQMTKFLHAYTTNPVHYFGLLCILIFIVYFKKLQSIQKAVLFIVVLDVITDLAATYLGSHKIHNLFIYNISSFIEMMATGYIFYNILENKAIKKTVLIFIMAYAIAALLNISMGQGLYATNSYTYLPGLLVVGIFSFLYLMQCINNLKVPLKSNFLFWYAAVNMLNCFGSVIILGLAAWNPAPYTHLTLSLFFINLILYSIWFLGISFGLIWEKQVQSKPYST